MQTYAPGRESAQVEDGSIDMGSIAKIKLLGAIETVEDLFINVG